MAASEDAASSGAGPEPQQQLEQFTLLAKSLKGRAVVGVIQQALASKRVFVFGELLAMPNVQALRGTEHAATLELLELFCYGTYADYTRREAELPGLTPPQRHKLKLLSIVTACRDTAAAAVSYDDLAREVDASTTRDLEDLLIDAVYSGLVVGKMDQQARVFKAQRAAARDVRLEDVPALADKLERWLETAKSLTDALDASRLDGLDAKRAKQDRAAALGAAVDDVKRNLKDHDDAAAYGAGMGGAFGYGPGGFGGAYGEGAPQKRRGKRSRLPFK
eukprot:CAMPEP_0185688784 /NCGR_PEP_ID=MMETSP1164-20130828/47_1 /TAXON_ID=1104430 /ORGANISM="Chrysoreinhardia sp, Strain CCMP2950" /LENGTH=276 /DNA_ID=CAMNT_0028355247 /DNA_START=28 /DNA_END=858 /DNA_ORIENTATION=+